MKCEEHNVRPKNGREKGKLTRVLKTHSVALGGEALARHPVIPELPLGPSAKMFWVPWLCFS